MKINVKTPSRIHFGLMDMNGELGRVNGGCGVALQEPHWFLTISLSSEEMDSIKGEAKNRVEKALKMVKEAFPHLSQHHHEVVVKKAILEHVGLGSWTQLLLALAKALHQLENRDHVLTTVELARTLSRGGTSGIGIAAFEAGGFIVDGGHSTRTSHNDSSPFLPYSTTKRSPPPILVQVPVADKWWFAVIEPKNATRLGGGFFDEEQAFEMNCPLPADEMGKVVRLVTIKLIPGFIEHDFTAVTESINSLQFLGFKKTELKLVDRRVVKAMRSFHQMGIACGLSALGPSLCCVFEDKSHFEERLPEMEKILVEIGLQFNLHAGPANNTGAVFS